MAVLSLLLAFGVDPSVVSHIQGILNASTGVAETRATISLSVTPNSKPMKTIEIHKEVQQGEKFQNFNFFILVKDESGAEVPGVKVEMSGPNLAEPEVSTTTDIGRVIVDNPDGDVRYTKMHTGAAFAYFPTEVGNQTITFRLPDEDVSASYDILVK